VHQIFFQGLIPKRLRTLQAWEKAPPTAKLENDVGIATEILLIGSHGIQLGQKTK